MQPQRLNGKAPFNKGDLVTYARTDFNPERLGAIGVVMDLDFDRSSMGYEIEVLWLFFSSPFKGERGWHYSRYLDKFELKCEES